MKRKRKRKRKEKEKEEEEEEEDEKLTPLRDHLGFIFRIWWPDGADGNPSKKCFKTYVFYRTKWSRHGISSRRHAHEGHEVLFYRSEWLVSPVIDLQGAVTEPPV